MHYAYHEQNVDLFEIYAFADKTKIPLAMKHFL